MSTFRPVGPPGLDVFRTWAGPKNLRCDLGPNSYMHMHIRAQLIHTYAYGRIGSGIPHTKAPAPTIGVSAPRRRRDIYDLKLR